MYTKALSVCLLLYVRFQNDRIIRFKMAAVKRYLEDFGRKLFMN